MKWEWRLFVFQMKKMRIFLILTVLFLYPVLVSYQMNLLEWYESYGGLESAKNEFFQTAQNYLPTLGVLWGIFINRLYFDGKLAEVIYTADRKGKIRFTIYGFLLLQLLFTPLYLWYVTLYSDWQELLRLILQTYAGMVGVFFFCSLFRSGILAAGVMICGVLLMQYMLDGSHFWNWFQGTTAACDVPPLQKAFLLLCCGAATLAGALLEKIHFL